MVANRAEATAGRGWGRRCRSRDLRPPSRHRSLRMNKATSRSSLTTLFASGWRETTVSVTAATAGIRDADGVLSDRAIPARVRATGVTRVTWRTSWTSWRSSVRRGTAAMRVDRRRPSELGFQLELDWVSHEERGGAKRGRGRSERDADVSTRFLSSRGDGSRRWQSSISFILLAEGRRKGKEREV